jgi:8-oxo-dGTP pyrophosphatase MutT (NUDIX family)
MIRHESSLDSGAVRRAREVPVFVCSGRGAESRVLMLRRSNADGGFWHCIAGALDQDEKDEDGAARELREETGFARETLSTRLYEYAYPIELAVPEHRSHYPSGTTEIEVACFRVDLGEQLLPTLNVEHDAYRWCGFDEVRKLFRWPTVAEAFQHVVRELVDDHQKGASLQPLDSI